MDYSCSTPPPVPLDVQSNRSTPHFPLLDSRIDMILKRILQKMNPVALAAVRESSSVVELLLSEEARKRKFVARATLEEFMRPDVVQIPGEPQSFSEMSHTSARMHFHEDHVQILRRPTPFSSTSLLFHQQHPHSDSSCSRQSYEFWKSHIRSISAATAMSHLAGSKIPDAEAWNITDAAALLDLVRPYNIRVGCLWLRSCSPASALQLLNHFQPTKLCITAGDSQEDYQQSEAFCIEQIGIDKMVFIHFESATEYPGRLIEYFWRRFQQSPPFLWRLSVDFPPKKLPQDSSYLHFGMECHLLRGRVENVDDTADRVVLLRTKSAPVRHILLHGGYTTSRPSKYRINFLYYSNADGLIHYLFPPSCDPDKVYPAFSRLSPSEIRRIFNSPNVGPV